MVQKIAEVVNSYGRNNIWHSLFIFANISALGYHFIGIMKGVWNEKWMVTILLKLITYQGKRPTFEQIRTLVIENRPYTYIVATKALEKVRSREGLLPKDQVPRNKKPAYPIALFHQLMREWAGRTVNIASRGEEKTMIIRSIQRAANQDDGLKNVLKQDVSSWVKALADLASNGNDLTVSGTEDLDNPPVNPFVGDLLKKLQQEYYRELSENDKHLFEKEIRDHLPLLHQYIKPVIIMEGFTFLTPLQQYFVQICHKLLNRELIFIVPYHPSQEKGYERIHTTYFTHPDFAGIRHIHWSNEPVSKKEDLHALQEGLFGNPFQVKNSSEHNVKFICYPTRDREILSCIETLKTWFNGCYKPNEVAIVVRNLTGFKEKLQDFLHSARLTYLNNEGKEIPVQVQTSSRLLLLTPVGRFILTLYEIWRDNQLLITNEQLETVLSSGWLGASIQDSTIPFRAVKHQYFLHCETEHDWEQAMDDLERIVETEDLTLSERMPLHLVTIEDIGYWRKTLGLVKEICERLFQTKQGGISYHIKLLQDQLKLLEVENVRQYEQDVLEKIQEVFEELENLYSLDITSSEFGEALHSLVSKERENEDEEDSPEFEGMLWIATPEGIDGMERKAVLYMAVDNQHVPAKLPMSWPFYEDKRDEHMQNERYMFLTVVRAALEVLVITCCRNDGNTVLQPSPYLLEMGRLLDRKIVSPTTKDLIDASLAPKIVGSLHRTPLRKKSFKLTELVQYGLCPLRFSLEKRHPAAKVYRNDWQLEVFAQGVWIEKTFEALAMYYGKSRKTQGIENVYQLFCRGMMYVEHEVKKFFPSFDDVTWHGIKQRIQNQFDYYAQRGDYPVYFEKGKTKTIQLLSPDVTQQVIKIEISVPYFMVAGRISYPLLDSVSSYEWLLPGKKEEQDEEENKQDEEEKMTLFSSLYEARQWWKKTVEGALTEDSTNRNTFEESRYQHYLESKNLLQNWIIGIWNNVFPHNRGDHCKVCPVRTECLGVEMEGTFY